MFKRIMGHIGMAKKSLLAKTKKLRARISTFISKRPFATLFVLLGILLLLIILGNILSRPTTEEVAEEIIPKQVSVYRIGEAPTITVQAQVEKSGVVTITALTPGVVQQLNFLAGDKVSHGQTLLTMSTNYQGGNAPGLQSAIAARTLQNINETYDTQKEIIAKQKEIAEKVDSNNDELRSITDTSLQETRDLISFNDDLLTLLDSLITAAATDAEKAGYQQSKSSFTSANNSLRTALRTEEYTSAGDKAAAEISDITKDIAVKQLDLQEKAIDLNRDVARLQLSLARVQEAAMYPSSPFNSTVQRVFVKVGEAVSPGTPLIQLSQVLEEDPIVATAYVPREIAQSVSYGHPSMLTLGNVSYEAYPSYITQDAIQGNLYGVYFPIPDSYGPNVVENGYITVNMPVGYSDTSAAIPFIPIDTVYQTQESAYVYVVQDGVAVTKEVVLGPVLGRYVEVQSGLGGGDIIILNRNIISGDAVDARS